MNGLRLWIGLLALTSFLAGTAGGVLLAGELRPAEPDRGPFADYREALVQRFELSEDRELLLRVVLDSYHRELEALKLRHIASLDEELVGIGARYRNDLIRNKVIPADRRAEFDQLVSGRPGTPALH